jgi:hypothetical protein
MNQLILNNAVPTFVIPSRHTWIERTHSNTILWELIYMKN